MSSRKKIGIIGFGSIGSSLIDAFSTTGEFDIEFVLVRDRTTGHPHKLCDNVITTDVEEAFARAVDLVIEAAVPQVASSLAIRALQNSDFCAFSCTALASEDFQRKVDEACLASGRRFFVPHGAVLGLDGIADGRQAINEVVVTTTKSGLSLGIDPDYEGIVFEGTARAACQRFPRNVNVHAAVALAGIGFDKTLSRIIAVPGNPSMEHRISVAGEGLSWDLQIRSLSLGGITGSYTPMSSVGSVRRILGGAGLQIA